MAKFPTIEEFAQQVKEMVLAECLVDGEPLGELIDSGDLVHVCRCKDCKFYEVAELNNDGTPDKRCKPSICANGWYEYAVERDPNWFCADAEPKEKVNGK